MKVGLITPDAGHPLLAATAALLAPGHEVRVLDPAAGAAAAAAEPADVYLLKARTPSALALARELERRGATVVNSAAATERCQDRAGMAELALRAGLPFAATRTYDSLAGLGAQVRPGRPVVVKSRLSRKHDLVARLDGPQELRALAAAGWEREPVVVQPFAPNDGWDHKLWVIGDRVFAGLRRSNSPPGRRSGPSARAAARRLGRTGPGRGGRLRPGRVRRGRHRHAGRRAADRRRQRLPRHPRPGRRPGSPRGPGPEPRRTTGIAVGAQGRRSGGRCA